LPLDPVPAEAATAGKARRARLWFFVRLAITIATFWLLIYLVSIDDLIAAARRIPAQALALCVLAVFVGQLASVQRFQLLLDAYGADSKPRWRESLRLFLVAAFYNTYLPGAVAGDVLRAVAVRKCFANSGLTSALAVSFVERVTGVSGMLILTASVAVIHPIPGIRGLLPFSLLGLVIAGGAIGAIVVGRRLAPLLPARLAALANGLPVLHRLAPLAWAVLAAMLTHACTAIGFHALIRSLTASATLAESLVIVPLACSAMYIPATVAGAGTRDAAFVLLYRGVGVSPADALAMSLAALLCTLLVAGLGGIANMLGPYEREVVAP
jgi:glycosyltransferase 2 family protein